MFVIDEIDVSQKVKKVLDEIAAMSEFAGKAPEKVALYPTQFLTVKRGCLAALKRKYHRELKSDGGGNIRRLKAGEFQKYLEKKGFAKHELAEVISWNGITLYDKAAGLEEVA